MKYINLTHTTENKLSNGTPWIDFYHENLTNGETIDTLLSKYLCPVCGQFYTEANPVVGAHIARISLDDMKAYIVPMCDTCNKKGGVVEVDGKLPIVAVPKDSPHYGDIRFPENVVNAYKTKAPVSLKNWNGHVS